MKEKYYLEPAKDTQAVIQLLEDKIYQHNANKLHKDDGYIFSRIIRDEKKKLWQVLQDGHGQMHVR